MKVYETQQIRNLSILGHAGTGKTTFAEGMIFLTGGINRRGSVEDQNTVSDFHDLEHEKSSSVFATPLMVEYEGVKLNFIDTPGYDDYVGETIAAINAADVSTLIVNAHNGIEVGTEIAWVQSDNLEKPVIFFINKLDDEQANFDKVYGDLKDQFGGSVTSVQYPVSAGVNFNEVVDILEMKLLKFDENGKVTKSDIPDSEKEKADNLRNEFVESIAESDEDLMNKYFDEGDLNQDDLNYGLKNAIVNRMIFPVFCASSKLNIGPATLLSFAKDVLPSPVDLPAVKAGNDKEIRYNSSEKLSLYTFKMFSDPRLGDITYFKVMSGKLTQGKDLIVSSNSASERIGQLSIAIGKNRTEVAELAAGDIGAVVKMKNTHVNDTLHEKGFDVTYKVPEMPNPKVRTAVGPKVKGEEEKVGMALHHLHEEDPSLIVEHSQELRQIILHAQGEQHLNVAKWRLENRYKVQSEFIEPKVPYRETIQKQVKGSYRHKKQSGGAGQFAEVHMMIEPWVEGMPNPAGINVRGTDEYELDWGGKLVYLNCIVGGVIDQRFLPAILKGVMEKMEVGPLTGSYVRDIRVAIYDGKMHPVDSNEAAFKMAGARVFSENFIQASPQLLEPIYKVKIRVPEEFVGDVMSDLPTRRGMILGIDAEGRYQIVNAQMPLAEVDKYATGLRSMTQARATYSSEFFEYAPVPSNIQQDLMNAYKSSQEED